MELVARFSKPEAQVMDLLAGTFATENACLSIKTVGSSAAI